MRERAVSSKTLGPTGAIGISGATAAATGAASGGAANPMHTLSKRGFDDVSTGSRTPSPEHSPTRSAAAIAAAASFRAASGGAAATRAASARRVPVLSDAADQQDSAAKRALGASLSATASSRSLFPAQLAYVEAITGKSAWTKHLSADQTPFWHNQRSGETTWENPDVAVDASGSSSTAVVVEEESSAAALPAGDDEMLPPLGWERIWSKSRERFYFRHQTTGETSWERP